MSHKGPALHDRYSQIGNRFWQSVFNRHIAQRRFRSACQGIRSADAENVFSRCVPCIYISATFSEEDVVRRGADSLGPSLAAYGACRPSG
jgi:hypothetical protein